MKESTKNSIDRYVKYRCPGGDFIEALMSNDLKMTFRTADDENIADMREIVSYVYNHVPITAQGSPEKYKEWVDG